MRMNKLTALALAAALCAGLLTACGRDDSSMTPTPTPPATHEDALTPETGESASATATPEQAAEGYTAEGMTRVLDSYVSYEAGTAGGSLKAAMAAAETVRYASLYGKGHAQEIRAEAENWKKGLDAEKQALLAENWPDICYTAKSITADPEKTRGLLADAGVTEDFSGIDLETASACVDTLNEVFGGTQ